MLNKSNSYRLSQEVLRNKALTKGVNLIAPETIFLSKDTSFGRNVTVEPYVVFGPKVKVGDNSYIKSFSHLEGTRIEKNVVVFKTRVKCIQTTGYNGTHTVYLVAVCSLSFIY